MAIRYKSRNSKRRYENDWMQDRNSGALEEHPALAISRTLKDDYFVSFVSGFFSLMLHSPKVV